MYSWTSFSISDWKLGPSGRSRQRGWRCIIGHALLRMVRWCIRLTRLTLVCEVIRYRLGQVRQNLKKRFPEVTCWQNRKPTTNLVLWLRLGKLKHHRQQEELLVTWYSIAMQSQESAKDNSLKISSLPLLQQKASHGCLQGNCLDRWPFLKHLKANWKCHPSSKSDLVVNAGEALSFNWKAEGNVRKEWLSPFQLKPLLIVCDVRTCRSPFSNTCILIENQTNIMTVQRRRITLLSAEGHIERFRPKPNKKSIALRGIWSWFSLWCRADATSRRATLGLHVENSNSLLTLYWPSEPMHSFHFFFRLIYCNRRHPRSSPRLSTCPSQRQSPAWVNSSSLSIHRKICCRGNWRWLWKAQMGMALAWSSTHEPWTLFFHQQNLSSSSKSFTYEFCAWNEC